MHAPRGARSAGLTGRISAQPTEQLQARIRQLEGALRNHGLAVPRDDDDSGSELGSTTSAGASAASASGASTSASASSHSWLGHGHGHAHHQPQHGHGHGHALLTAQNLSAQNHSQVQVGGSAGSAGAAAGAIDALAIGDVPMNMPLHMEYTPPGSLPSSLEQEMNGGFPVGDEWFAVLQHRVRECGGQQQGDGDTVLRPDPDGRYGAAGGHGAHGSHGAHGAHGGHGGGFGFELDAAGDGGEGGATPGGVGSNFATLVNQLPSREMAVTLLGMYWRHYAWSHDVVPHDELARLLEGFYSSPPTPIWTDTTHPHRLALLFAVLAMGGMFAPPKMDPPVQHERFFRLAGECLRVTTSHSVAAAQTLHILVNYSLYVDPSEGARQCSPVFGETMRIMQSMGLHRGRSAEAPNVFWEVLVEDVILAHVTGRPGGLPLKQFDVPMPQDSEFNKTKFGFAKLANE